MLEYLLWAGITAAATGIATRIYGNKIKKELYDELESSLSMRQTNINEDKKGKWDKIYARLDQQESRHKESEKAQYSAYDNVCHNLDGLRMKLEETASMVDATISDLTWAKTGLSNLEVEVKHLSQSFEYLAKQDAQDLINELHVELVPVVKAKKKSKKLQPANLSL